MSVRFNTSNNEYISSSGVVIQPFTWIVWVKLCASRAASQSIISTDDGTSNNAVSLKIDSNVSGTPNAFFAVFDTPASVYDVSAVAAVVGTWYKVALVRSSMTT